MSVLELNLKEREEVVNLEKGEYTLKVEGATPTDMDQGRSARIAVRCSVEGHPDADQIFHPLWYPSPDDTARQRNRKKDEIESFLKALGLPDNVAKVDPEEWVGLTFSAILDEDEYEGETRNVIAEVVTPR